MSQFLEGYFGTDGRDDSVRRKLVESLYAQPVSLILSAAAGIACCAAASLATRNTAVTSLSVLVAIVAILRVGHAVWLSGDRSGRDTGAMETIYELGAFSYAFLCAVTAATTVYIGASTDIQTLMVSAAIIYGLGVAARNAGRPIIAIGQLVLSLLPVAFVCILVGGLPFYLLAGIIGLVTFGMSAIILNTYRVLRDHILAAESSANMANQMRELARTDVVTGLLNRAGMNHELMQQLMALPAESKLALFWIDLDRFKEINDTLGHTVGDRVLAEVAARLRKVAPPGATIARFGGDEFIVGCQLEDRAESERLAQAMRAEMTRTFRIFDQRIDTGASMGVALLPEDGSDIDTLMQSADLALYHAKSTGPRQIRFFTRSMTRALVRRKEIESELRAALQRDELSIFFQPIVDLQTGRIRSFEALVRWFHPEKGELRPDEFIPVAEDTGVIITLGNWITSQAAKAAAQWPADVTIAVNLSPIQLRAPGAALGILNSLREAGLDPSRLELEVTESLFIEHSEHTARFMEELAAEGVCFALDDFGTGYSSLGYINQFPFKKIKVDRSFVSGPNIGRKSDAIIRAVAEMGSTLQMEIVAEGLETLEQVQAVREAGCSLGQGYYFSRAVPDFLAAMLIAQDREQDRPARLAG